MSKFFNAVYRDRESILPILLTFIILPNLIAYSLYWLVGLERSYIYIDYLAALLPICFLDRKYSHYISAVMLVLIFTLDVIFVLILTFHFNLADILSIFSSEFINSNVIDGILSSFLKNDFNELLPVIAGIVIMLLSAVPLYKKVRSIRITAKNILIGIIAGGFLYLFIYVASQYLKVLLLLSFIFTVLSISLYRLTCRIKSVSFMLLLSLLIPLLLVRFSAEMASMRILPVDTLFNSEEVRFNNLFVTMQDRFVIDRKAPDSASNFIYEQIEEKDPAYEKIVLIVVESFGVLQDEASQNLIYSALDDPEFKKYYEVSIREGYHKGSTVPGEFRELCGYEKAGNPAYATTEQLAGCLPSLLKGKGYITTGIHNAGGKFFDRDKWYPKLGFDKIIFNNDVTKEYGFKSECGSAFVGICEDRMFNEVISNILMDKDKEFLYFLTVQGHMPIDIHTQVSSRFKDLCNKNQLMKKYEKICGLSGINYDLLTYVKDLALKLKDKKIVFVIAGDHKPPFYFRKYSKKYKNGKVPYIIIRSR